MLNNNTFGNSFRVTTFGESHGPAIGVTIDGCPSGLKVDLDEIRRELARRRPGQSRLTSKRDEKDEFDVLSGLFEGITTGAPLCFLVKNLDVKSHDYSDIADVFRPGHADFGYFTKFGVRDYRGGGRSSARETVGRVIAGSVARQLLSSVGIVIRGAVIQIGNVIASNYNWDQVEENEVRSVDPETVGSMVAEVQSAREQLDSVGGIVEVQAIGVMPGLGEPVFGRIDAYLAGALMSIPAAKGVEIGLGFRVASMRGSQVNDQFFADGFHSNAHGGTLGGISSGAPIVTRIAFKPTPSIPKEQHTLDVDLQETKICVKGRHDPCVAIRAVPVAEAMVALCLMDLWLIHKGKDEISRALLPRGNIKYSEK